MIACGNHDDHASDLLSILMGAGCDIHAQDVYGYTALMILIQTNSTSRTDIIQELIIMSKTSLSYKSIEGKTAYDYYMSTSSKVLDEYFLCVLKLEITVPDVKSARK